MGLSRRARDLGVALAILALTALVVARISGGDGEALSGVARAVDGDTLSLGRHRIRLVGIDAPELAQSCRRDGAAWPCGAAARRRLGELLRAGPVTCRPQSTDRYGRLLARCETADGDPGARLVREGLAVAYGAYQEAEALARAERGGLWGSDFKTPQDWRRANGRPAEEPHGGRAGLIATLAAFLGLE